MTKDRKRELLTYLISGLATTAISWACMFGANYVFFGNTAYPTPLQNFILSLANWISGVSSAYILNRLWVFRSHGQILPELAKFVASRLSTLAIDQILRQAMGMLGVNVYATTVCLTVLVTVLNYIISKAAVFRGDAMRSETGGART